MNRVKGENATDESEFAMNGNRFTMNRLQNILMNKTEFIYFDLGNVILDFDHDVGCRQIAELADVTPEHVRASLFDSGLEDRFETGLIDADEFHALFCDQAKCSIGKSQLLHAMSDIFQPKRDIFPVIAQLSAVNFPIGILSNTCSAHWDHNYSRFAILREFFSTLILSYEVKSMKPDGKIYQQAIASAGCDAESCYFVDDKQENVDAAIAAGMDAELYVCASGMIHSLERRGININL